MFQGCFELIITTDTNSVRKHFSYISVNNEKTDFPASLAHLLHLSFKISPFAKGDATLIPITKQWIAKDIPNYNLVTTIANVTYNFLLFGNRRRDYFSNLTSKLTSPKLLRNRDLERQQRSPAPLPTIGKIYTCHHPLFYRWHFMKCSSNRAVTNADTAKPPWRLSGNKTETSNRKPSHCTHLAIMDSSEQQLKPQRFLRR